MIHIKNKLKRVLYLLSAVVILLSTFPISAGATVSQSQGYIDIRPQVQGFSSWTAAQTAAVENLQIYVNYFGKFYTLGSSYGMDFALTTKSSSGEYLGNYGYILNTAPYEIILSFATDDWTWYCDIVIPAGTERVPSQYVLSLDTFSRPIKDGCKYLILYSAEINRPIASTEKTNTSSMRFYAKFPDGTTQLTHTVTPPSGHVGLYSFKYSDVQNYVTPTFDGYVLKGDAHIPSIFYISPDGDSEYVFEYTYIPGSTRTVHIKYLDEWSNILYTETIYVPLTMHYYTLPGYQHYRCFPGAVDIDLNLMEQTVKVWCLDYGEITDIARENGYKKGYEEASQEFQIKLETNYSEGYEAGYKKGISQNVLLQEQIDSVKKLQRHCNPF